MNKLFVVEELESRLAKEAVAYKRRFEDLWKTHKFEPTYFDGYISGPLLNEFSTSIFEHIRPLNNHEINRYLSLSLQQFETHTPQKRYKAFLQIYDNARWFPGVYEYVESEFMQNKFEFNYATHVWINYNNHFHLFKEAFQKIYDDFKAGLLGLAETAKPLFSDENFKIFITNLKNNNPVVNSPISYYNLWRYNLSVLKKEVLSNLIYLEHTARKPYINLLKFELNEELHKIQNTQDDLSSLYDKYETSEEQLLRYPSFENRLHSAIYDEPSNIDDTFEEEIKYETKNIQFAFYNFHCGAIIRAAIDFLDEQAFEYGFENKKVTFTPVIKTKPLVLSFKYFKYDNSFERLTDLMNLLKRSDFIHQDTSLSNFRSVFSEKEIDNKIIWTGNLSELAFFIKSLHNTAKKVKDTKQKQWEITINCFEMADGSELTKDKLRTQKVPANAYIIEKAVSIL